MTPGTPEAARDFRLDLRTRAERFGRNPDHIKVLPGVVPIIAETSEQAEAQQALLSSVSHPQAGLSTLSYHLGRVGGCAHWTLRQCGQVDADGVLPEDLDVPGVEGHFREVVELTRRTGLSVAQIGHRYGAGRTTSGFTGTPGAVADRMQAWQEAGACDGFMLQIPYFPGGLESVVRLLWPQRSRGLMGSVLQGSWGLGALLSSAVYALLYDSIGWRGLLLIGVLTALLIGPRAAGDVSGSRTRGGRRGEHADTRANCGRGLGDRRGRCTHRCGWAGAARYGPGPIRLPAG